MQILLAQAYPLLASGLGVAWAVGESYMLADKESA